MKRLLLFSLLTGLAVVQGLATETPSRANALLGDMRAEFKEPPPRFGSRPLWFWNGKLEADKTRAMAAACKAVGYHGMGILPTKDMGVGFMTQEFLAQYQVAVDEAEKLGLKMCLYDEFWFPSGSAGGLLATKHPEALSKRLDLVGFDMEGPGEFVRTIPPGTFMGAVAMDTATKRRLNISTAAKNGRLNWSAPAGSWKVMIFTCVRDGRDGLVDYLSLEAVKKFIGLTYQGYYNAFPRHFGATIDSAFYDEPGFWHTEGGRAWTASFNEKFRARHRIDPVVLYPALWFDIGPDTASARNALFGFRAELYATGFVKTVNDWCRQHRVGLTGHVDQEELVNPVIGQCGDLIKAFKYQDMPGIDQIFAYGRASGAYKLVSSAAYNYDRPQVMVECYGATERMPVANLYKEAMDQFAKGINTMVPHAVWYHGAGMPPDLTPGATNYGPELPAYNRYIGRLQRMLQTGRHVADIGVLYPIATLQAGSWFGPGNPYEGGVAVPEADYMKVGELLALGVRRDFTFIHPEILERRCVADRSGLRLNNPVNWEHYRVFVLPGSRCVGVDSLRKIKKFYDRGGRVIATTRLPDCAAEKGGDAEVRQLVAGIFGAEASKDHAPDPGTNGIVRARNVKGGSSWFVPSPTVDTLQAVLDEALPEGDVVFEDRANVEGGNFSYIHKVVEGRDVYFFANSSNRRVETWVRLRGGIVPELWDPHTGDILPCEHSSLGGEAGDITRVRVKLAPVTSVFVVDARP